MRNAIWFSAKASSSYNILLIGNVLFLLEFGRGQPGPNRIACCLAFRYVDVQHFNAVFAAFWELKARRFLRTSKIFDATSTRFLVFGGRDWNFCTIMLTVASSNVRSNFARIISLISSSKLSMTKFRKVLTAKSRLSF